MAASSTRKTASARSAALVSCLIVSQVVLADSSSQNATLDAFVSDVTDENTARHYNLVSKQSAIHQMLVNDCMKTLGFEDEASSDPVDWSKALDGEYAYCQDHHIPGIDPPCPAADIVELSITNSCWQKTQSSIDWSHDIMRRARQKLNDERVAQQREMTMQKTEAQWSACMQSEGFDYHSRFNMYESLGQEAALSLDEKAALPERAEVMQSAEHCFETTQYYEQMREAADRQEADSLGLNTDELLLLLARYETAESFAEERVEHYCKVMPVVFRSAYEREQLSEKPVCEE